MGIVHLRLRAANAPFGNPSERRICSAIRFSYIERRLVEHGVNVRLITSLVDVKQFFDAELLQFFLIRVELVQRTTARNELGEVFADVAIQHGLDVIQDIIGVNLFGGIWASRAAAQQLVKEGHGGRIINISSIVAMEGLKGCVDYAASKGGLIAMSRSLAKELASYGITVNTVAPGVVQRPAYHDENYSLNTNFLHIKCEATDIANMVLFLASDEARFITGQTYVVDGGRSLAMKGSDV